MSHSLHSARACRLRRRIFAGIVGVTVSAACSSSDATGTSIPAGVAQCTAAPPLTRFPLAVEALAGIMPLGLMSGGGHLFPAPHLGLRLNGTAPLYAPGDIVITEVRRTLYTAGSNTTADYALFYFTCAEVRMHFGHIPILASSIEAGLGAWSASDCAEPYAVGGVNVVQCSKRVTVRVSAGEVLGTQSGVLDWGATDSRHSSNYISPTRLGGDVAHGLNYAVCPVDYLPAPVQESVHNKFASEGRTRTAEPVCGTVMQDVPRTAQGRWFLNDDPNERLHLALVRDYIDPRIGAFSVGTSIPSLPTQLYRFSPVDTGRMNLDFPFVQANGMMECYETEIRPGVRADRVILIQLLSDTRLRIEGVQAASCGPPAAWRFTSGAVEFAR